MKSYENRKERRIRGKDNVEPKKYTKYALYTVCISDERVA